MRYVKQFSPDLTDLSGMSQATDNPLTRDYPTGAWGAETREYHVCVEVEPGALNQEKLAARVQLRRQGRRRRHAAGRGQGPRGLDRRRGPVDPHQLPGRASTPARPSWPRRSRRAWTPRRPATWTWPPPSWAGRWTSPCESGNENTVKMLRKVTEVDPATSRVRAKAKVDRATAWKSK